MVKDLKYPDYMISEDECGSKGFGDRTMMTICATPIDYNNIRFVSVADYQIGTKSKGAFWNDVVKANRNEAWGCLVELLDKNVKEGKTRI